jgi:hypothetical protein
VTRLSRARRGEKISGGSYDRLKIVGLGCLLGAVWGVLLWGITTAAGQDSGGKGLIYFLITCAMIGGGVAAGFGAGQARRRGEQVAPKLRLPFRRRP